MKLLREYSKVTLIHKIISYRSYEIHQKKLIKIKEELEIKRVKKVNGDASYEHLKS